VSELETGVFNILNDNLTVLKLSRVIGGKYVKDWCCLPYEGYSDGCPQCERCKTVPIWYDISKPPYYFVIRTFDLAKHTEEKHQKFPDWSEKQCRNSRLWQSHQDKLLKDDTEKIASEIYQNSIIMLRPEMYGVNVFSTCRIHGYILHKNPTDIINRISMIGEDTDETIHDYFR
jgi:hypothetical protein